MTKFQCYFRAAVSRSRSGEPVYWSWACIAGSHFSDWRVSTYGCDLPKTLIGTNKSNRTEHRESEAVARFNDRLLASAGATWDDWLAFNPGMVHVAEGCAIPRGGTGRAGRRVR